MLGACLIQFFIQFRTILLLLSMHIEVTSATMLDIVPDARYKIMRKLTLIDKLLQQAQQKCQAAGGRFTDKRSDILKNLISAEHPLSAYDLVELYNQNNSKKIQPMSVYRILDFFIEMQLVHKLPTLNKYVVCSHLACKHNHQDQYFVVCKSCGDAQEIATSPTLTKELSQSVSSVGYQLIDAQFELLGICNTCANNNGN